MAKKAINNETRSVSSIQFKPDPAINNGLCVGYLEKVEVGTSEIKQNSKMEMFRGMTIPRLNFIFKGYSKGANKETYVHGFMPWDVTDTDRDSKSWDSIASTIKHFAEVLKGAALNASLDDKDFAALLLDYDETKEDIAAEIIKGFTTFFNNTAILFNGGTIGKTKYPSLLVKDDKPIKLHLKLLLYLNDRDVNQGNPGLSAYPGEGLIEEFVKGIPPRLSILIQKGESITPRAKVVNRPVTMTGSSPIPGAINTPPSSNLPDWMDD